jgi:hypothetical protein
MVEVDPALGSLVESSGTKMIIAPCDTRDDKVLPSEVGVSFALLKQVRVSHGV